MPRRNAVRKNGRRHASPTETAAFRLSGPLLSQPSDRRENRSKNTYPSPQFDAACCTADDAAANMISATHFLRRHAAAGKKLQPRGNRPAAQMPCFRGSAGRIRLPAIEDIVTREQPVAAGK